ncbi:hypothetical protein TWF730_000696 [Orbilia blumenaviensis]|uniref:Uncharacterized protein n=1 Tax=Orbilia blumenaviensis TaxID=1796055 RepID=A0AAV9VMK7_9PEZI
MVENVIPRPRPRGRRRPRDPPLSDRELLQILNTELFPGTTYRDFLNNHLGFRFFGVETDRRDALRGVRIAECRNFPRGPSVSSHRHLSTVLDRMEQELEDQKERFWRHNLPELLPLGVIFGGGGSSSSSSADADAATPTLPTRPFVLPLRLSELIALHPNFRICPITPLIRTALRDKGIPPPNDFLIEDQSEPAHIIKTDMGWWAWDLKGEFMCFVTGSDERLIGILREGGERWGERTDGLWDPV